MATWALVLLAIGACGDAVPRRPIGAVCQAASECETGICGGGGCLSAEGDDDLDGVTNAVEAALGSNPSATDTDADGLDDFNETRGGFVVDTDGDGTPDVLESMLLDQDGDCVPDQIDANDDVFDTELSGLVPVVCRTEGVCAGALLVVTCDGGQGPRCEHGAVGRYEAVETSCDGRDNDCNGLTDEGHGDLDFDRIADCVDPDRDGDGIDNDVDVCPDKADPLQSDSDGDGLGDACDPPDAPALLAIAPASPSAVATPALTFATGPENTVAVFGDAGCGGTPIASAKAGTAAGGVAVELTLRAPVALNMTTRLSVRATNAFGLNSVCAPLPQYTHDDVPPPPPTLISASPPSPSQHRRPTFTIGATDTEKITELNIHLTAECSGTPAFKAAIEGDRTITFTTEVTPNTELVVYGQTRDAAGNLSTCGEVTRWRHDTVAPCTPRLADGRNAFATPTADVPLIAEPGGAVGLFSDATCAVPIAEGVRVGSAEIPHDSCRALWLAAVRLPTTGALMAWAQAVDGAGNVGACEALGPLTYDRTPPEPARLIEMRALVWADGEVVFAGRGATEPGAEVEIHVGQSSTLDCAASALHTARADADGAFVFPLVLPTNTDQWLRFKTRDVAGNVAPCAVAEPLVGNVTVDLPPLAGPSSLLISDERGGIIEEIPLIANGPAVENAPDLTRRIVRGASLSLAHRPDDAGLDEFPDFILSHFDVQPGERLTFGRGWYATTAPKPLLRISAEGDSGAYSHTIVVSCTDGHWENIDVRTALPVTVAVPLGCLAAGETSTVLLRPNTPDAPSASAMFTATASTTVAQDVAVGPWVADTARAVTLTGGTDGPGNGLALLVGGETPPSGQTAPQFWLDMARTFALDADTAATTVALPSLAPANVPTDAHTLLALAFDLFERIRLVSTRVPAAGAGETPTIDLEQLLPDATGLFTVRVEKATGGAAPVARALFPSAEHFDVTASFVEVRWNDLGTGGRPLVWQAIQSSQRTSTRFPDLPGPPSLLAQLRPPGTSAAIRDDLDRATHAVYAFADGRVMTAARTLLATELFNGNLAGPPILPRAVSYWSAIAPGRFDHDE